MEQIGIYIIKNLINGKVYVGSTCNFKRRFIHHLHQLRLNIHHSIKLQNSYNKYGEDSFLFEKIQYCKKNKEELQKNEQFWIDYFNSYNKGYNGRKDAISTVGKKGRKGIPLTEKHKQAIRDSKKYISIETRELLRLANTGKKHSEERNKRQSNRMIGKIPNNRKSILQFDLKDNFIQEFCSQYEAAFTLNINQSNICAVLKGRRNNTGNFKFKYK